MLSNVQQFVAGRQLLLGRRIFRVRNPKLVAVVGDVLRSLANLGCVVLRT
jgi:hypothetical protein